MGRAEEDELPAHVRNAAQLDQVKSGAKLSPSGKDCNKQGKRGKQKPEADDGNVVVSVCQPDEMEGSGNVVSPAEQILAKNGNLAKEGRKLERGQPPSTQDSKADGDEDEETPAAAPNNAF